MPRSFAQRLHRARTAAGLTAAEVCALTGMAQPTYSRLETGGRASPSWETLARLVGAGIGLEHFFPGPAITEAAERIGSKAKAAS